VQRGTANRLHNKVGNLGATRHSGEQQIDGHRVGRFRGNSAQRGAANRRRGELGDLGSAQRQATNQQRGELVVLCDR
jgi:hypothetical protein